MAQTRHQQVISCKNKVETKLHNFILLICNLYKLQSGQGKDSDIQFHQILNGVVFHQILNRGVLNMQRSE